MQSCMQMRAVFFGTPLGSWAQHSHTPSPLALLCDGAWDLHPESRSGPWELQLYKAIRQLGQALAGGGLGGVAKGCWERRGSEGGPGWGVLPSAPSPHDTKGPLSSLQPAGKGSVWWLPCVPWFCLQGKQTGSVAFLYFLVSAEPKNIARGTVRIYPQPAGIALAQSTCFTSSRTTFGH